MKAMMTAMMTAAIKRCLFIFLPSACLSGLGLRTRLSGAPRHWGLGGGAAASRESRGAPRPQAGGAPAPLLVLQKGEDLTAGKGQAALFPCPTGVGIPGGGPQFLGSFVFPRGSRSQGSGSLCAFCTYHGLSEKMGGSYTC